MRLTDQVSILSSTVLSTDSHGNPVVDWTSATVKVEPATVVPVATSELLQSQDTVTTRFRAFLLPGTVADAKSRILWKSATYEVDGQVEPHTDARSRVHHREALLVRVTG